MRSLRSLQATATIAAASILLPVQAGEKERRVEVRTRTVTRTTERGSQPLPPIIREYRGKLTLTRAVEIALRQNPEILRAAQEIQRTRGQIIEVRAQALPQISLTGTYDVQDRRLLQSGGGSFGGGGGGNFGGGGGEQPAAGGGGGAPQGGDAGGAPGGGTGSGDGGDATAELTELLRQLQEGSSEQGGGGGGSIQNKSWRVAVEARQVIYSGGQIRAALAIAKLTQDSAYFQLRDTVDRVISQTRQQFYNVLLTRALIQVSEEAVRLAEQQLQDQRNRFEAGTVPRFNVLRAEVELANEQPNLIRARNDYLLARLQLAKTLGLNPGPGGVPGFEAVGTLSVSMRGLSLEEALALARARRPFLKVQRQAILIEGESIQVEMAGYKPRLNASAGYELRNNRASDDLGDTLNGWFYGINGSWDIFDGFETYGRVKQARARLEQAKITYDDSVRQVELEVQTAFANLRQARETIQSQQKNVEQALEALRLAQERLAAGAGTQLEVLDARVALTRARTTELRARADYNTALADFDRTTALETVYDDSFRDPLGKVEKGIFARIAETALPPPPRDDDAVAPAR